MKRLLPIMGLVLVCILFLLPMGRAAMEPIAARTNAVEIKPSFRNLNAARTNASEIRPSFRNLKSPLSPATTPSSVEKTSFKPAPKNSTPAISLDTLPVAMRHLNDEHKLNVGDKVAYQVVEDGEPPQMLVVTDLGELDIPLLGRVEVTNKTCKQVAVELKELLEKKYYNEATVLLQLDSISKTHGKLYVYGQVRNPGTQEIPSDGLTLSRAILNAGGFTELAESRKVKVLRRDRKASLQKEIIVDIQAIFEKDNKENDIELKAEDSIIVAGRASSARERIYIYGQIRSPGPQELPPDGKLTLSSAILNAGGFSSFADGHKVKVFRKNARGLKEREIVVDVMDILKNGRFEKDIVLQPGDHVMIPEKMINF